MSSRIVLATHNEHKVGELRQILAEAAADLALEIVSVAQFPDVVEPVEDDVTFEGNARLKALAVAASTGLPALADDSGLAVDVLGGAPGIFSARWSGSRAGTGAERAERDAANLQLLLEQLCDVKDEHRGAAFVCAAVLAMPDGRTWATHGRVRGSIAREPRGSGGFGYDPILLVDGGQGRTLAEYSASEKHSISHRGNAFRAMLPILREYLG